MCICLMDTCFNVMVVSIILFLFDSSCTLDQLKGTHNENEERLGTEDDQVSNEVAELVKSFKENNEVESEIVRKLFC